MAPVPITYEQFGVNFVRLVLDQSRVLESIARVLGERIELGPMKAGPGRVFASVTAVGTFQDITGTPIEGDLVVYRVLLPIDVVFDLDLNVDRHRFEADVLIPLTLTVRTEAPLTLIWDITLPTEDEVTISVSTKTRRGALLQRVSGLDAELRRFLIRVVEKELSKPHVQRATHIDMGKVIDGAWPALAEQFLPNSPEDRLG